MQCKLALIAVIIGLAATLAAGDVLQCSSDGRIAITEQLLDSEVEEVRWIGNASDHKTIFVRTRLGQLWYTDSEGKAWTSLTSVLERAKTTANGTVNPSVFVTGIIHTAQRDMLYITGTRNDLWVTNDRGKTFIWKRGKNWGYDSSTNSLRFKPHHRLYNVAIAGDQSPRCTDNFASGFCYNTLWITDNFGDSWRKITDYVGNFYWGHEDKIWYETSGQTTGAQNFYNRWTWNLYYSTDFGRTSTKHVDHVAGFVMKFGAMFIAQLSPDQTTMSLLSSRKSGEEPLVRAKFPGHIDQNRYTILDTADHLIFINVEEEDTAWGNLYVSDHSDSNFVLSLERNKRDVYGHVGFLRVRGLEGIYLANRVPHESADVSQSETVITFNKGGKWHRLTPPTQDSLGKPTNCRGCSLHLHGILRDDDYEPWGGLYSKDNALGLILATGNIGRFLTKDPASVSTYFSRDAGVTWEEIRKGSHVYEFGDHGAITVLADNMEETNTILYSWNEGLNWTECKFTGNAQTNYKMRVNEIRSEPLATGQTFLLLGVRDVNNKQRGVLVTIDFAPLEKNKCDPARDYERWSPTDASGRNCFLGETLTYLRRKRDSECYNGEAIDRNVTKKVCPCGSDDYQCDYCYAYSEKSNLCVPVCNDTINNAANIPKDCKDIFYVSHGYRLIDGDKCDPTTGIDKRPTPVKCPPPHNNNDHAEVPKKNTNTGLSGGAVAGIVIFSIVFVVVVMLGVFIYLMRTSDRIRGAVGSRLPRNMNDLFSKYGFSPLSQAEFDESLSANSLNSNPNDLGLDDANNDNSNNSSPPTHTLEEI